MKKTRLVILIYSILISIALAGCSITKNILENKAENLENKTEKQFINASIVTKYNEKEIVIYSDTTCYFYLDVKIKDGETESENDYGEFKITEGEIMTLTVNDLAPGFFSDNAIIKSVWKVEKPYIYTDNPTLENDYERIDCSILMKYSDKEITIFSDTACYLDLEVSIVDDKFRSYNEYKKIEISERETLVLTPEDLAPGFFTDTATIWNCNTYIYTYVEK